MPYVFELSAEPFAFEDSESFEVMPEIGTSQTPEETVFQDTRTRIQRQLERRFSDPNDPRLYERRRELRRLFNLIPSAYARNFYSQLQSPSDLLGRLFRYKLHTATRNELLSILQAKQSAVPAPPVAATPSQTTPPESAKAACSQQLIDRTKGLLSKDRGKQYLGATRAQRLLCVLLRLAWPRYGDDRYVRSIDQGGNIPLEWRRISEFFDNLCGHRPQLTDKDLLDELKRLDDDIIRGLQKFRELQGRYYGDFQVIFQGKFGFLMQKLLNRNHASIYSCYIKSHY